MVLFNIIVKVISENIKEIKIDDNYVWGFFIECQKCGYNLTKEIYFTSGDEVEMSKGHGVANFLMKCKECSNQMSIAINNKSNKQPFIINCESGNSTSTICTFECRGCLLSKWVIKKDFIVVAAETETEYNEVDITELWSTYDEKSGLMLNLLEPIEWVIEKQ